MIIGYSVLYITDDTNAKDILWKRKVLYSTWEGALEMAKSIADKEKDRREDNYLISVVSSTSKEICNTTGPTQIFIIKSKEFGEIGVVYIVPVYDEY